MQIRQRVVIPHNRVRTCAEFLQNELRMIQALVTGVGLKQHTSAEYMQSLTDVMRSTSEDEKVLRVLNSSRRQ